MLPSSSSSFCFSLNHSHTLAQVRPLGPPKLGDVQVTQASALQCEEYSGLWRASLRRLSHPYTHPTMALVCLLQLYHILHNQMILTDVWQCRNVFLTRICTRRDYYFPTKVFVLLLGEWNTTSTSRKFLPFSLCHSPGICRSFCSGWKQLKFNCLKITGHYLSIVKVLCSIKFFSIVSRKMRIHLFKGMSCSLRAIIVFLIVSVMTSYSH